MSQPKYSFVSQHPDGNCKVIWDNKTVSSKQIKVYQSKGFFVHFSQYMFDKVVDLEIIVICKLVYV